MYTTALWQAAVTCQHLLNCCQTGNREKPLLLLFARLIIRKHCPVLIKWFSSPSDQIRIFDDYFICVGVGIFSVMVHHIVAHLYCLSL